MNFHRKRKDVFYRLQCPGSEDDGPKAMILAGSRESSPTETVKQTRSSEFPARTKQTRLVTHCCVTSAMADIQRDGPLQGLSVEALRRYVLSDNVMESADKLARSTLIGDICIEGHELRAKVTGTAKGAAKRAPVYNTSVVVGTNWRDGTKYILRAKCDCPSLNTSACKHEAGIVLKALGCPEVPLVKMTTAQRSSRTSIHSKHDATLAFKTSPEFWQQCAERGGTIQRPDAHEGAEHAEDMSEVSPRSIHFA